VDTSLADPARQREETVRVEGSLQEFENAVRGLPTAERDRALASFEPIRARWVAIRDRP
jgi:hypothetical protein